MSAISGNAKNILRVIGAANIALLFFITPLYTGGWLPRMAPTLFADAGVIVIALWGLVYLVVAGDPARYVRLLPVLALEKAFYAATWAIWLVHNNAQLPMLVDADPLAGIFYAGYGLWDGACALLLLALWRHYSVAGDAARG